MVTYVIALPGYASEVLKYVLSPMTDTFVVTNFCNSSFLRCQRSDKSVVVVVVVVVVVLLSSDLLFFHYVMSSSSFISSSERTIFLSNRITEQFIRIKGKLFK